MALARPLITLTTDFGTAGYFAGAMKGVLYSICPDVEVVDISHDLPPYEVGEAAFLFEQARICFPRGTIHVAVVDPGVGSSRKPIAVESGGHIFVGPDNGVFTFALNDPKAKARHLTKDKYFRHPVSGTFHGRDVFAPCAAHIASGVRPSAMGPLIADALRLSLGKPQRVSKRQWSGLIVNIDRFGNIVTNLLATEFPWFETNVFEIAIGMEKVDRRAKHFAECEYGELYALTGSSGYIEIVQREANAARRLGVSVGAPVDITGW